MIRDYLYQLQNIIYSSLNSNKIHINNTVKTNEYVIRLLKNGIKGINSNANLNNKFNQLGGVGDIDAKLKKIITKIDQKIILSPEKPSQDIVNEIEEIGTVSIQLIQFLGKLIDQNKGNEEEYKKIQEQIVEMVQTLSVYLNK